MEVNDENNRDEQENQHIIRRTAQHKVEAFAQSSAAKFSIFKYLRYFEVSITDPPE